MLRRLLKLVLVLAAAAGGVVAWQRRHETPATPPSPRPAEPFMTAVPRADEAQQVGGGSADPVAPDDTQGPRAEALPTAAAEAAAPVAAANDVGPLPDPPRSPATGAAGATADDLTRISGVGPKIQAVLHEQGITTFAQLAALDDDGIERLQDALPQFPGRIRRDDWVGQARRLKDT